MQRLIPGLVLTGLLIAAGCGGGSSSAPTTPSTDTGGGGAPKPPPGPPQVPKGAVPVYHQMDPTKHTMANRPVFGRIDGRGFDPKVVMTGNRLTFRQGKKDAADVEVAIELPLGAGETADGRTFIVHPEQKANTDPKVTLKARATKGAADAQEKFAMTLTFGTKNKDGLPGKIQLCFPDAQQSYVVGEFEATKE